VTKINDDDNNAANILEWLAELEQLNEECNSRGIDREDLISESSAGVHDADIRRALDLLDCENIDTEDLIPESSAVNHDADIRRALKLLEGLDTRKTEDGIPKSTNNLKTVAIAGGLGAAVGLGTIAGAFTAKLLASRSTIVKNYISLVINCFLPFFNETNNLLRQISPNLDLNKFSKAITDPKVAALIVGVIAGLGAISSALAAGAIAHKVQASNFSLGS
jgi:F0F1-type ATP synthase membrane subunit c/vacuolar-type H+-ATPase subunit K